MRLVLAKIISPLKSAFVKNRDIHDKILIACETLSPFNKHCKCKCYTAIKLDIEKA